MRKLLLMMLRRIGWRLCLGRSFRSWRVFRIGGDTGGCGSDEEGEKEGDMKAEMELREMTKLWGELQT